MQAALKLRPEFVTAHYMLGHLLEQQGRREEAIAEYRETIRLRPEYGAAHYTLANALDDSGKHDEAMSEYREVIRLDPTNADAHNALGNVLDVQGKHDDGGYGIPRSAALEAGLCAGPLQPGPGA